MDKMGSLIKAAHYEPRSVFFQKHPITYAHWPMD